MYCPSLSNRAYNATKANTAGNIWKIIIAFKMVSLPLKRIRAKA
ncbi:Uncharacterised protein [Vibrio cholerae]|nr:Uncharacterised protein [Vibrio cholerae]